MTITAPLTCQERIQALREIKLEQTREKQRVIGSMDRDDLALVLPPAEYREVVQTMGTSGLPISDVLIKGYSPTSNHPSGAFFGARACGANFRALLESHPPFIEPLCSLAGAYCVNFSSYRKAGWNPDFDYSHLRAEQQLYQLVTGIGGGQHFCHDLAIGLEKGWGGILADIRHYREANSPCGADFYDGIEDIVLGIQTWIRHNAEEAQRKADDPALAPWRGHLLNLAEINQRLTTEPPQTFHEACQWMAWYQMAARMYNGSGALGRLDELLWPYYQRDTAAGILDDEEAILHLASLLLRDTGYIQLGGPDASGKDVTNPVSFLVLEAAHRLKIPANVGVCVGHGTDERLLRRGLEIMFEDRTGIPKFLGIDNTVAGFCRNGYPLELARRRAYSGCHWSALPGREYTLNDCVKISLARVFEVAWNAMMSDDSVRPSTDELWYRFEAHLRRAIEVLAEGLDFHMEHMHEVFPELMLDLLCYGPIERGLDASHGGVDYYNLCVDGAGLAIVADSFAALAQRVEQEQRLSWQEVKQHIDADWGGEDGERARLMMRTVPRYGSGDSPADEYAIRVSSLFTRLVKERPTPYGFNMIPGLFSWANTIPMGKSLGGHAQRPSRGRANLARGQPRAGLSAGWRTERHGPGHRLGAISLWQCRAHADGAGPGHLSRRGWARPRSQPHQDAL